MYKTFYSYFTDKSCKLYTRNIRWQGVVEHLEVSGCKFWPIIQVECSLTARLTGHMNLPSHRAILGLPIGKVLARAQI